MGKRWVLPEPIDFSLIKNEINLPKTIWQLLCNRGIVDDEVAHAFLNPCYVKDLHDPFLFRDMQKAVERIHKNIVEEKCIVIHGDYDADGVTSSSVVASALRQLGGCVRVKIPHREREGYGINMETAQEIIESGCDLVITVDCGISNVDEVNFLKEHGVDVIITDHHHVPPVLPEAYAIINPQVDDDDYPFPKLAGVGVAYKVMSALLTYLERDHAEDYSQKLESVGGFEGFKKWLLDLVSIGTIADCMPLIDENRALVTYGMKVMRRTRRLGLKQLVALCNIELEKLQPSSIGFKIAPCLNAAGRMDDGRVAFDLLVCDTLEDAARLSEELVDINKQRQNLTEKIVKDIKNGAADMVYHGKNTIFVYDKDWKIGVLGLIAGRLSREHNKPTFALTNVGDGIVGSGRSIDAFDMIAALHAHEDLFERFGGHKQACGLTISNRDILNDMVETIDEFATAQLENVDMTPILNVDMEIDLSEVTWDFVDLLTRFEPFGMGNSQPLFLIRGARICGFDLLGKKSNHIRFSMCDGKGIAHKMMAFSKGNTWSEYLEEDLMVDVVCTIGINYWRGNKSIQMTIEDIRPAEKHLT